MITEMSLQQLDSSEAASEFRQRQRSGRQSASSIFRERQTVRIGIYLVKPLAGFGRWLSAGKPDGFSASPCEFTALMKSQSGFGQTSPGCFLCPITVSQPVPRFCFASRGEFALRCMIFTIAARCPVRNGVFMNGVW
jgi:hypothetical protein